MFLRVRWSLKSMMVAVAVVAVFAAWPILLIPVAFVAAVLGGPLLGGWIAGRWGVDRIVAGSVAGGVVLDTGLGAALGFWLGVRSEMLARPAVVVLAPLLYLFLHILVGAAAGAGMGVLVGAVAGSALASRGGADRPGGDG